MFDLRFSRVAPRYIPSVSSFSCRETVFFAVSASFLPANLLVEDSLGSRSANVPPIPRKLQEILLLVTAVSDVPDMARLQNGGLRAASLPSERPFHGENAL